MCDKYSTLNLWNKGRAYRSGTDTFDRVFITWFIDESRTDSGYIYISKSDVPTVYPHY